MGHKALRCVVKPFLVACLQPEHLLPLLVEVQIRQTNFLVHYDRTPNIREKMFEFEKLLGDYFVKPFQLQSIPDDAPPEIPRIGAVSRDSARSLNISQANMGIASNFKSPVPWNKVVEQTAASMRITFEALAAANIDSLLYSGLSVQLIIPMGSNKEVTEHLSSRFFSSAIATTPHDVNCKLTFVDQERYYVNYTFSNRVDYAKSGPTPRMIPAYMKPTGFGLSLLLDINDRYGFNHSREYDSSAEEGSKILELMNDIMENRLAEIVETGHIAHD